MRLAKLRRLSRMALTDSTPAAVTLDGTVIHKAGTITGGTTHSGGRQFEDQEVEALRRRQAELTGKLSAVFKDRPPPQAEERLVANETRIKADLQIVADELSGCQVRLKGVQDQLKTLRKKVSELDKTVSKLEDELAQLDEQAAAHRDVIEREEDAIFSTFCARIGVRDIREYEEKQLRTAQEGNAETLKFETHVARLQNQIRFQTEQVDETQRRLDSLEATAQKQRVSLEQLDEELEAQRAEIERLEQEVKDLRLALERVQETLAEKQGELEAVRKEGGKAGRVLDKALKEIASCVRLLVLAVTVHS